MYQNNKEDVLLNVTIEMNALLNNLGEHYNKPVYKVGLEEFERIDAFLKASLADYDPAFKALD